MGVTKTGAQRAAIIKAIEDMGGPRPQHVSQSVEAQRAFWCESAEFLYEKLKEAESRLDNIKRTLGDYNWYNQRLFSREQADAVMAEIAPAVEGYGPNDFYSCCQGEHRYDETCLAKRVDEGQKNG